MEHDDGTVAIAPTLSSETPARHYIIYIQLSFCATMTNNIISLSFRSRYRRRIIRNVARAWSARRL